MFRVDVPGMKDRFYTQFRRRFPSVPYPTRHTESEAYVQVQAFKQQVLIEFLQEIAAHAKAIGYEKVGVIEPYRSRGNIRLYSDRDIALLQRVRSLVDDMGVNLPGVEVILRMIQRVGELQNELEQAQKELKKLRGGK